MRISGVGSCVLDVLHDLPPGGGEDRLAPYLSRTEGDGGLRRGGAVLRRLLEARFGRSSAELVRELGGGPPRYTLGGVAAASLVATAQLLHGQGAEVRYYTNLSDDEGGAQLRRAFARTPLSPARFGVRRGRCPSTTILNEQGADGTAERSFITEPTINEELALHPAGLDRDFFESQVTLFAGVRWEPHLCADLTRILADCRRAGSLTVLGTAYVNMPGGSRQRWPLGDSDEAYRHVDLLVMDRTEALGHSGEPDLERATAFFKASGVGAFAVTQGVEPVLFWSGGGIFAPAEGRLPIPSAILQDKASGVLPSGDSVGCGDNFLGGVVASTVEQLRRGRLLDLRQAVIMGSLSGGIASTHAGGVLEERAPGEKRELVERYRRRYEAQLAAVQG
jgi:sugar/nucleoside kinase (ribokinase family)